MSACSQKSSPNAKEPERSCTAGPPSAVGMCMPDFKGDRKAGGTMVGLWLSKEAWPAFNLTLAGKFDDACRFFIHESEGGRFFEYQMATRIEPSGEILSCDYAVAYGKIQCINANPPIAVDLNTGVLRAQCTGALKLSGDSLNFSGKCEGEAAVSGSLMAVSDAGLIAYMQGAYYCSQKQSKN